MQAFRGVLVVSLSLSLLCFTIPVQAGGKPLGILTLAYSAYVNTSEAFAGLSIFPGEVTGTDPEGKAMVRIGESVATLSGDSSMTLEPIDEGAHVDLLSGSIYVSSTPKNPLEVHALDALLRPHGEQKIQAQVLLYGPNVLQVTTRAGSLNFSYHGEFRVLPEGQTYRLYLDSEPSAPAQGPAGAGSGSSNANGQTQSAGNSTGTKVAYFILAGAGAGLAAWGIHDLIESNNGIESPAKP